MLVLLCVLVSLLIKAHKLALGASQDELRWVHRQTGDDRRLPMIIDRRWSGIPGGGIPGGIPGGGSGTGAAVGASFRATGAQGAGNCDSAYGRNRCSGSPVMSIITLNRDYNANRHRDESKWVGGE